MKRERLLKENSAASCIEYFEGRIKEDTDLIEREASEVKRWDMVYAFLFEAQLHYAIYKYSKGDDVDEIQFLIKAATESFINSTHHPTAKNTPMKDSFFVYDDCLSILSLNLIFETNIATIVKLAAAIDLLGNDMLIDKMLSYVLPDRQISKKLYWPKIYTALYAIFDSGKEERPEILKTYLQGWYKNMQKASWYNAHKNKEVCSFFGYWSFESAAITHLLHIDDSSYGNMPYYPKDLVDFARKNN